MKIQVYNISWDVEDKDSIPPPEMEIEISDDTDDYEIEYRIEDKISEITGYTHYGFEFEIIEE